MSFAASIALSVAALPAGAGSEAGTPWVVGRSVPELALPTLEGEPRSLAELCRGRTVVVVFGSWSPECRRALPDWDAATRAARAAGELRLVGIAVEQHPDRALLLARWKELDWPILWDPFARSGVHELPRAIAIDGRGVVRAIDVRPAELGRVFAEPAEGADPIEPAEISGEVRALEAAAAPPAGAEEQALVEAMRALERGREPLDPAVELLLGHALREPRDALGRFRAGVAVRLRHDSPEARPGDLQLALDLWAGAFALAPDDLLYRRRVQQHGPRTDKPYSFYGWTDVARRKVRGRGGGDLVLAVEPTPNEAAQPRRGFADPGSPGPDPEGAVPSDGEGWIRVESAVVFATDPELHTASLSLVLLPDLERGVRWDNQAGRLQVWLGLGVPEGWRLSERLFTRLPHGPPTSQEQRVFDLELELPPDSERSAAIGGYVLFDARLGEDGPSERLRHDFVIEVSRPARGAH